MSGKGGKTTQTNTLDPDDTNYINAMRNAATSSAAAGNANSDAAGAGFQGGMAAGAAGTNAISSGNYSQFMNPYMDSVINPLKAQWAQTDAGTQSGVDSQATAAGAFGGSRSGVAEGTAQAQNNMNENQQIGDLENQGFSQATQQALSAANLGMGASQSYAQLGQNNALLPGQILSGGYGQQTGSTQTTQASSNPWSAILGLAGTVGGAALGGPMGASVGGSIGSDIAGSPGAGAALNVAAMTPQELGY